MRILKKFLKGFLILICLSILLLYIFDYEYILKGIRVVYMTGHTTAYIDDHPHFDNRTIESGDQALIWPDHKNYNKTEPTERLKETNANYGTVAYLIIKNDSVWYESYAEGYGTDSQTNSFSMAKSIVTLMLGKAIEQGHIESLDQPVGDFIPEFSEGLAKQMTVGDLSSMSSGLNWDESYKSPFSITARAYYDEDLESVIKGLKVVDSPGERFRYLSGNTELLAMVIEKATGKNLSDYLSENFWKPMGMTKDALWQLDSKENGLEKAYCCIASHARDFAKFGKLILDKGNMNGKQILPASFIDKIVKNRFEESPQYGYGFWLSDHLGKNIVVMRGILGQYVISIPEDDMIIVRLGHQRGKFVPGKNFTDDFFIYVEEAYKMMENAS